MGILGSKPQWELEDLADNPELKLFQSVISEFNDISGISIDYYIKNQSHKEDYLYGEDAATQYLGPYRTKVLYEPTAEESLTNGYGTNSNEVISFASITKFTFSRDVSAGYHPKPGDAIVTIWNNRAYSISDVDEESKIFQLSKQAWNFVMRPFRFSDESDSSRDVSRFTRLPTDPNRINETISEPLSAFGDNKEIENDSEDIFTYNDTYDSDIYGF
jgi:hypothetical protein